MAAPKMVVIVNPRSGGGQTERRWPAIREMLHEQLGPYEARFTTESGGATALARTALAEGADVVVALGGDGTINEVVNGFFDGVRPLAPRAALGILPAGTGGDFIRTAGVPRALEEAAARIRASAGAGRTIDVGRLHYTAHDGAPALRHFINVASLGIGGLVDRYVNESSKRLGGKVSFALATLKAGIRYRNPEVRIRLDQRPPREGRIYSVAVANGRFFGGGMMIAPTAELDDGFFDVVTMGDMHLGDLLLHGLDIYRGRHLGHPKVRSERARRVEAVPLGKEEVLLDVDGEQPGRLPASFEIVPGALRLCGGAEAP